MAVDARFLARSIMRVEHYTFAMLSPVWHDVVYSLFERLMPSH
jgi:hypothetical protein